MSYLQNKSTRPKPELDPLQAKKEADATYIEAVELVARLFSAVKRGDKSSIELVTKTQDHILWMFKSFSHSLLMESLLVMQGKQKQHCSHAVNVALFNLMIGEQLELHENEMATLARAGVVHDLGMLHIPENTWYKTSQLTQHEKNLLKSHPQTSASILDEIGETNHEVIFCAATHHEQNNGEGYPQGLAGEEIPLLAQVNAVSVAYATALENNLTNTSSSPFEILAQLSKNEGQVFYPTTVKTSAFALAKLLVGRRVTLSDNSIGVVMRVNPRNLAYPIVQVIGKHIQTGPELYPTSLSGFLPLF